jgi:N-acetylated-alpha-linked acidic dipeptidase
MLWVTEGHRDRSLQSAAHRRRGGLFRDITTSLVAAVVIVAARASAQGSATTGSAQPTIAGGPHAGYTPANATAEAAEEARAIAIPSPAQADSFSQVLSREPHMAGTPAQARTRDFVVSLLKKWGLETEVRSYDVYMPHPIAVHVWRFGSGGDSSELSLAEGPVPGDPASSAFPQVPTFNGYSGTGSGAGEVVYANYGLIEDYAHLDSVGVSVKGKIVIARYGHSFRGIKAREAERHGAVALLIYSDPGDDGYVRGDTYPEGPMRPPQGVQRGSIMNGDGDPSTPGYPSTPGAHRLDPAQMEIPHIPVVPIGYRNATLLLQDVRGIGAAGGGRALPRLPQTWQGGLPFRYHIGPGPSRARVSFEAETGQAAYHTIWDTFGYLRGTEFPDQLVMVGGHRDAWGPGAADNVSGTVSVLEIAHALAEEARAGHRPKRTIAFATWDAEEWGLVGSTEYVEDDSLRLTRDAVAYLNLDVSADGPNFGAAGSPSLRAVLRDITRVVSQPDSAANNPSATTHPTVFDGWRASATASDSLGPKFGDPGGGSDFAGFANHLGIPILGYGFTGFGGVYHSAYDDYTWLSRFGDPGFIHHAAAARLGAALLLRLANADVVPFDYVEYARTMRRYIPALDDGMHAKGWSVSTAPLTTAIDGMERAAAEFAAARDSVLAAGAPAMASPARAGAPHTTPAASYAAPSSATLRATNAALLRVERALTRPAGLRTRPWFRSLIYAADEDNGYANIALPSVAEAIRSGDTALTTREITDLASRFDAAAVALREARDALHKKTGQEKTG